MTRPKSDHTRRSTSKHIIPHQTVVFDAITFWSERRVNYQTMKAPIFRIPQLLKSPKGRFWNKMSVIPARIHARVYSIVVIPKSALETTHFVTNTFADIMVLLPPHPHQVLLLLLVVVVCEDTRGVQTIDSLPPFIVDHRPSTIKDQGSTQQTSQQHPSSPVSSSTSVSTIVDQRQ